MAILKAKFGGLQLEQMAIALTLEICVIRSANVSLHIIYTSVSPWHSYGIILAQESIDFFIVIFWLISLSTKEKIFTTTHSHYAGSYRMYRTQLGNSV